MQLSLDREQREQMTVAELSRFLFRLAKDKKIGFDNLHELQQQLCSENERLNYVEDKSFFLKFYEAIAQLKRRGLLVDVVTPDIYYSPCLRLTSVGEKSDISDEILILIAEAVIERDASYQADIENQRSISALTRYFSQNVNQIFKPIADSAFRSKLKDKLEGMARIYRLNRNDAGHPTNWPQDWQRDEQECFLSQFRRYVLTVFKAIDILSTT